MKLRTKIFISILVVSLITLFTSCYYLINHNHLNNVSKEQERSLNDMDFIRQSLLNSIDTATLSDASLQVLLEHYDDFYSKREIHLLLYKDKLPLYVKYKQIPYQNYSGLIKVRPDTKMARIISLSGKHYIIVSSTLIKDNYVLVYTRDISETYDQRIQSIKLSVLFAGVVIIALGILSYCYSRWITKPIVILNQGATAIANGDYSVRITAPKDEFYDLGVAFNQMAIAVESRTRELEERAKELQIFIDDLSHEMNTPLTSIQGYSEFLLSANSSEEQKNKAVTTIRSEAKRMKDIYTKLLTLSLVRENELEFVPFKISELFDDLDDIFQPLLQTKQIHLTLHSTIDSMVADYTLIQLLISNLIKNSIHAMQTEGTISLQAYSEQNNVILEVTDQGCGIPDDKINDVIKPFFRVDKSRSRKTGGAGLGLSICKRIADLHHADFVINSTIGVGTSIKVIFYNSFTTS